MYGAALSHTALAARAAAGDGDGARLHADRRRARLAAAGHTVVEVVTDDMPFLVDSVTDGAGHPRPRHPRGRSTRSSWSAATSPATCSEIFDADDGRADGAAGRRRPRVVDAHRDRPRERTGGARRDRGRPAARCCATSARPSRTGPRCARPRWRIVEELETDPPPLPTPRGRGGAGRCCDWLADDHFTFLGYREYALAQVDGEDVLQPVPGRVSGILRADQDMSPRPSASCPRRCGPRRARSSCSIITKANSRATVHRPAYLDYIGVKWFDGDGEVIGERRFLGLFTSAAYTESLPRIPVLRRKAQRGDRAGRVRRR